MYFDLNKIDIGEIIPQAICLFGEVGIIISTLLQCFLFLIGVNDININTVVTIFPVICILCGYRYAESLCIFEMDKRMGKIKRGYRTAEGSIV